MGEVADAAATAYTSKEVAGADGGVTNPEERQQRGPSGFLAARCWPGYELWKLRCRSSSLLVWPVKL